MTLIVCIGPGSIGQAIARRVGVGKRVVLADLRTENATAAAKTMSDAGYVVTTAVVDVASRESIQALQKIDARGADQHRLPLRALRGRASQAHSCLPTSRRLKRSQ